MWELSIPGYEIPIKYVFGQWNPSEVRITDAMQEQMYKIQYERLIWQPILDSDTLEKQYGFTYEELEELTYTGASPFAWYRQIVTPVMEQALLDFLSSKSLQYTIENCYAGFVRYGDPMWRDDTLWIDPHWINIRDFLTVNPNTWRKKIHYELIENIIYQITNDNIPVKKCLKEQWKYEEVTRELLGLKDKLMKKELR